MENITPSSFGEVLKAFRKRRRFTQQQLAEKLGVHRNTIGTWEHGDVLPESKGMVLELVRLLRLDDLEARRLLEASLTALASYWSMPFHRNPLFTAREDLLETLHQHLSTQQMVALTQSYALYGLGGIGKTSLAVEYAYRHALSYSAVFWIAAESVETMLSSLVAIAEVLNLPERQEAEQQRIVAAVQRWLGGHKGWLLIWDNVEDLELLQHFLPPVRQGSVLITTRLQALGTLAQSLELQMMEPEEGMLLLLRRAKVLDPEATSEHLHQMAVTRPQEYAVAQHVVTAMGGLPLALDQAGAYIEETGCGLFAYWLRYQQQRIQMLDRRGIQAGEHPQSVTTTFLMAMEKVEQQYPEAAHLLCVCAFLHAEAIPEELFLGGHGHCGPTLVPFVFDPAQLDVLLAALRSFSLIQRHPETRTLSLHRMVQVVLQERVEPVVKRMWIEQTVQMINAALPPTFWERWPVWKLYTPHVLVCQQWIAQTGIMTSEAAHLLQKGGMYLKERGRYEDAEIFLTQAVACQERLQGLDHPTGGVLLNSLADLALTRGQYEQAESLFQRALAIGERHLGPDHPQIAQVLNDLGRLYWNWGKSEQVEGLWKRALTIREHALREHHLTAQSLNNLAFLYHRQGKLKEAESLFQRAVVICEDHLEPDDYLTADVLSNLARLSLEQRNYTQAEAAFQRSLRIYERSIGPDHYRTAGCLAGIARLYRAQGKEEEAESLLWKSLTIKQRHLGQNAPEAALDLRELALIQQNRGEWEQAKQLLRRACTILEQRLSRTHPETVKAMSDYHQLLKQQARSSGKKPAGLPPGSGAQSSEPVGAQSRVLPACPTCHRNEAVVSSGSNRSGSQRFRCSACRCYFTPTVHQQGYDESLKSQAMHLAQAGMSCRAIAHRLGVHHRTISRWIKAHQAEMSLNGPPD